MRYEEFKHLIIEKITFAAPAPSTVSVRTVRKNNGIAMDGITILGPSDRISPTFYIIFYYERYQRGEKLDDLVEEILQDRKKLGNISVPEEEILSKEIVKKRVHFKIINYDMNALLLKEVPHRKYLDLAMVFYFRIHESILPEAYMLIRNEHLAEMGLTEKELADLAMENTINDMPLKFGKMSEYFRPLLDLANGEEDQNDKDIYILTNRTGHYGAGVLFYPDTGKFLRDRFDSDLIMIPCSVHEWIVVEPDPDMDLGQLDELIRSVNGTAVPPDEILSGHSYIFERDTLSLGYRS